MRTQSGSESPSDATEGPSRASEPVELEVERLGEGSEPPAGVSAAAFLRALAPVLAGLFIDLIDFATIPPILGMAIGALAGVWVANRIGLYGKLRLWVVLGSALYCALPGTNFIPAGTVLGALSRFKLSMREG